ncbi:MAG: biotin/lipoyl-binding protein [Synergistaceae bacterium]|nr:biotin/lipoyl-binding protein [Synergistaceae bacterium]MBR2209766.1 biotin/lipoyl-binding protein [Synergistaceae bacterium]
MSNKYRVVVDGTAYTVEVESLGAGAAIPAPVAAPVAPAAPAAPAPAAAPAAEAPAAPAAVAEGASTVTAPMPGKILNVKVNVGDSVNNGDLVLLLEAMKMENEVFATASGKVTEVRVKSGDSVNTGDVLLVIA